MIVTNLNSIRTWWFKMAVLIVFSLIICGSVTPTAFAEEPVKEAVPEPIKVWPTVTITLQDEDGKPIRGIGLYAISADFASREKGHATTNETGQAVFRHLKSGAYYFYAHFNAIRRHDGYAMPAMIREFKTSRTYYISETKKFDLKENGDNVEATFIVKRGAYILFETYLQTVRSGKIIIMNPQMGMEQIIPVASNDYLQIYLPMRTSYKIVTIKDNDFDSWILEFYAHERLRIELL